MEKEFYDFWTQLMGTGSAKLLLWMISDDQRQRLVTAFCVKIRRQQMEKELAMQVFLFFIYKYLTINFE